MRGKVIDIEGIDRVGKHTQSILMEDHLHDLKIPVKVVSFPNYGRVQARPVEDYLAGDFPDITGFEASMLYALDRSITFREATMCEFLWNDNIVTQRANLYEFLEAGGWIVCDRYTPSNYIHQSARQMVNYDPEKPIKDQIDMQLIENISSLEYDMLKIPRPDEIFYLSLDREVEDKLLDKECEGKKVRGDIHENDETHLDKAALIGAELANLYEWHIIDCNCDLGNHILPPDDIHNMIFKYLEEYTKAYTK
jgi:dTMP kinase